eukprot:6211981-Pleurochrysis_carterae.AAC.1
MPWAAQVCQRQVAFEPVPVRQHSSADGRLYRLSVYGVLTQASVCWPMTESILVVHFKTPSLVFKRAL